ncbi:MAG: hypothetical protein H8D67_16785 [Deltaproteobacteria bacterium]|nr:hypothetical protein [Deltaproteobacteria bacterium]
MFIKKIFKSKTIDFNAIATALIPLLSVLGVEIGATEVAIIFGFVNIILRFWTKKPLKDK